MFDADGHLWVSLEFKGSVARVDNQGQMEAEVDVRIQPEGGKPPINTNPHGLGSWGVPIYLASGPDGNMWCTELVGNRIARITPSGAVTEFAIPTANSRPVAIVAGPDRRSMWFSEEASHQVARIDMNGVISEFPVPATRNNMLLAGMAFDRKGNLWAQSPDLSLIPITSHEVPTRRSILHRILQGPDGNIWFTELGVDQVARLSSAR